MRNDMNESNKGKCYTRNNNEELGVNALNRKDFTSE